MAKITREDEFGNILNSRIQEAAEQLELNLTFDVAEDIKKATKGKASVKQKGNRIEVEVESSNSFDDVIDLKKHFRQSPNRKESLDGGWHMIIPMRRYTGHKRSKSSSGMTSRLYRDLLSQKTEGGYAELVSDYLYDNRAPGSMIKELNYQPKGKGITRMPRNAGGHQYVTFRTVSDKSHPASWILNRNKADPNNMSDEVKEIIDKVVDYYS